MATIGQLPFTPRAKHVLEISLGEARNFGHDYIGTEHLILGLAHPAAGVAADALAESGVEQSSLREGVAVLLEEKDPGEPPPVQPTSPLTRFVKETERLSSELQELRARVEEIERRLGDE